MTMENKPDGKEMAEKLNEFADMIMEGANSHCRLSSGSAQPAIELLTEVMDSHKDLNSPDFNDCLDGRECQWCVEAKEWIEAHNSEHRQP